VETIGEIAYKYKGQGRTIAILLGNSAPLLCLNHPTVSRLAESQLAALGVKTVHKLRAMSSSTIRGKTEVVLSNGTKQVVDLYIDAMGGVPNSLFLPSSWLDSRKRSSLTSRLSALLPLVQMSTLSATLLLSPKATSRILTRALPRWDTQFITI
jgi:hypothetical protein